jgi:hypothetical protein
MKMTQIRMVKTKDQLHAGQSYNMSETDAYWLVETGFAVEESKPAGPSEIKPAAPSEIKAKKKRSRARTENES